MHSTFLTRLAGLEVGRQRKKERASGTTRCPNCDYVLDRPHAFTCPRCMTPIPGALGCNGCGQCRKR
jgi:uncharacterized paraquat-inducible protein A